MEKAYDHVNWLFVSRLMQTMGFGPRMSCLIFLLGQDVVSQVMLIGGYWGFCHNRNMCNAFVFDGRHGVKAYLMWQFSLLEQVEFFLSVQCSSIPLPSG